VGRKLAAVAKKATTGSQLVTFKTDEKSWGVTGVNDRRLASHSFGEYKNGTRLEAEANLTAYLCDFSKPRHDLGSEQFTIAAAVAAPGTGKSRLLDDTVRGQIAAEVRDDVAIQRFDPSGALLLPITFNGGTTRACVHDVASRCVLEFFCGQPAIDAASPNTSTDAVKHHDVNFELGAIDAELPHLVAGATVDVERAVLSALEALFFNERGGTLGRSVLLVDEISKALVREQTVYANVVEWVDAGVVQVAGRSGYHCHRGAVFTGLSVISPWAQASPSGRQIVQLALGLFDVWDPQVQDAILRDVRTQPQWANVTTLPQSLWSLLASAGGRPRDMENILFRLRDVDRINSVAEGRLMEVLSSPVVLDESAVFRRYLLASLLSVKFDVRDGANPTRFGLDVTSRALRNSDLLADETLSSAPSVSLRFYKCLKDQLQSVFERLVWATTFYELRGDGKDFEHVWVLLLQTHLLLQHRVRCGDDGGMFWPQESLVSRIGGRSSPTGATLQMFARGIARESALFKEPHKGRVYEAPGSTIRREIHFEVTEPSQVMVWQNLWVDDVCGGALVSSLDASSEVKWQSPALVYFTQTNHDAIDFMLLVGEMGGSGATEPHVYMFQCKAKTRASVAAAGLQEIVDKLDAKLDKLFSRAFEGNVLRVAGINSKKQVTLCVAALKIGDDFTFAPGEAKSKKKNLITPPFNVVLFDAASFRGLGGEALNTTRFMRFIDDKFA
jgi:hypothetical protein